MARLLHVLPLLLSLLVLAAALISPLLLPSGSLERTVEWVAERHRVTALLVYLVLAIPLMTVGFPGSVFVIGEAVLLDARTGREIWMVDVGSRERLTPAILGESDVVEDVLTAGSLTTVTVAEFERLLQALADYTADRIARELREDLRDVRR